MQKQTESFLAGDNFDRYTTAPIRAWVAVAILMVISIVSSFDRVLISLLVEPLRADLNISDFQISLLQGVAFGLFYAAFGVPMGWLVDRYPRRWVIYLGITGWSLAATTSGLAHNYWQLLLSRMGVGVGEATLSPAAYSIISDLFPRRRLGMALGIFGTGGILGIAVAVAGGSALVAATTQLGDIAVPVLGSLRPWQTAFIVAGLPGVLVALLIFTITEPSRRITAYTRKPLVHEHGLLQFLSQHRRYFLCHFLGFGCIAVLAYGMMAWVPVFLSRHFALDVAHIGRLLGSIGALAGVIGMIGNGFIADYFFARGVTDIHLRYFAITALIGGILGVIGFQWAMTLPIFLACYAVIYLLQPFTGPAAAHLQIVTPSQFRGRVSALYLLTMNVTGQCLGPMVVAAFTDFVFHDPLKVGSALALTFAIFTPAAVLFFYCGLEPARRAVAEMALGTAPSE